MREVFVFIYLLKGMFVRLLMCVLFVGCSVLGGCWGFRDEFWGAVFVFKNLGFRRK